MLAVMADIAAEPFYTIPDVDGMVHDR